MLCSKNAKIKCCVVKKSKSNVQYSGQNQELCSKTVKTQCCVVERCSGGRVHKKPKFGGYEDHMVPESVPGNLCLVGQCTTKPNFGVQCTVIPNIKNRVESNLEWVYRRTHPCTRKHYLSLSFTHTHALSLSMDHVCQAIKLNPRAHTHSLSHTHAHTHVLFLSLSHA